MMLTADSHVHSEWSWDTGGPESDARGTMVRTCERAVRIGLPALVFTEHCDFDAWRAGPDDFPVSNRRHITDDGYLVPPPLDVEGYLAAIDRCRHQFPQLTILTGVEFGQPHLFEARARDLVDLARFDRINGSLHTLAVGPDRAEPVTLYRSWSPDDVVWAYLEEMPRMLAGSDAFEVVTHLDYAVRQWPTEQAGPFDPTRFEDGFRSAMRAIAGSGRALEMNTRRLWSWIPQWWTEEGGRAVSFGSDAHVPQALADGFPEAQHMLEHFGFRPGARPEELWTRQVRS
jgi:histidinol-phosphatase (PHP family)